MQRSGREGVVVGLAAWEHVETDGRRHDGTCTGAAKRIGEACCGLRGTGTSRGGRTGTGQEMHGVCEADRRGLLWASLRGERGQAETEGREQGKRRTGSAKRTRRRWDRRRCTGKCRNEGIDAAKRTRGHDGGRRCTETGRNGPVGAAKRTGGRRSGLRGTMTDRNGRT